MPNSSLVGIDVSSSDNRVRLLDSLGNSISKFSVPNNQPGAKTLVSRIVSAMTLNRFYDLKYRETPKTPHKRALALTARKLVRLVFALLRDNRLYIPPEE